MNEKIKSIMRDLEFCIGIFDYTLTPEYCEALFNYIKQLQQENQKKLYTSNGNKFTKYELLDDYESILQENKKLKEKHYLIQGGRGNCKTYLLKLQQENQQLKEKVEWYEKENKHNQEIIIKDIKVLNEIREWSKKKKQKMYKSRNQIAVYMINDLLQILDRVKE